MSSISTTKMTAEQYFMLGEDPPGIRLELVEGEIAVSPSPTPKHGFVVMMLSRILGNYIEAENLGELYSDVDTLLNDFNVRRPDLLFFSSDRLEFIGEKFMEGPPDLAIEVLSPGSVKIDRKDKFAQYRKAGIVYYWIIDPQLRTLEGWELKNRRYISVGRAQGNSTIGLAPFEDLEIPLSKLWRGRLR